MGCAKGEKSADRQEAGNRLYKCYISVVLSKAWRSFLMVGLVQWSNSLVISPLGKL